jgi:hypothetical protein
MALLSRPVFSSWNLFNFNSFPNFKLLNVDTKSSYWNPVGPLNGATQKFQDKANESMTHWIFTVGGFGLFLLFYPNAKMIVLDAISWIPRTIAYSRIEESTAGNNYISRPKLEDQLEKAFTLTPNGRYYVVYGNKGVGKTELVTHAAIYDKKKKPSFYDKLNQLFLWKTDYAYRYGVVRIKVSSGQTYKDVFATLSSNLSIPFSLFNNELLLAQLKSVNWWWPNIYPTIIFDVECGGSKEYSTSTINDVRSLAKELAVVCRCIIVLSEANSVLEIGDDTSRERFIFVDELTIEEAKNYLQKRNYIVPDVELDPDEFSAYNLLEAKKSKSQVENSEKSKTEKENFDASTSQVETKGEEESKSNSPVKRWVNGMDYVFYHIGTKPADLVSLVDDDISKGESVREFVRETLKYARKCLLAFPLQTILQALKDNPEGVDPEYFNNLKEEGVDLSNPAKVGKVMKEKFNPIIYRQDLNFYQLLSTSHKTAIQSYDPINPLPIPS